MSENKLRRLDLIMREMKSFIIAFSGGVDSTFLLHRASVTEDIRYSAVTIRTPYIPEREIGEASEFCRLYGIKHMIIDLPFPETVRDNPLERCYLCKKQLFSHLKNYAGQNSFDFVTDGTNADDTGDYRPGIRALKEMGIRSPLMEAGLDKSEIRDYSRKAGLPTWDKPAYACLLTRIPYNTMISEKDLEMIEKAENFLFEKGFYGARVRKHDETARIECMPGYLNRFIADPDRVQIVDTLKKIGFRFISLDLEGYRTGSMNPDKKEL